MFSVRAEAELRQAGDPPTHLSSHRNVRDLGAGRWNGFSKLLEHPDVLGNCFLDQYLDLSFGGCRYAEAGQVGSISAPCLTFILDDYQILAHFNFACLR